MTSLPHDMVMINSEFTLLCLKSGHHVYQCNVHAQLAGSMQAIIYILDGPVQIAQLPLL